ncbi:lipoyl synthase [Bacteroidales bacterium OttesenSCG-928-C03]|nr:lipoyl synthase [Bacteroidales bacterium OttesenSCG-928-C03]MDL2326612.1 lipoyl synthase [Bacteroidales bacterium OttesenSCG-928-A14]
MNIKRKPDWLKIKIENSEEYAKVKQIVDSQHLHTICSSGKCPNMNHCWSIGTATFMIMGDICTRSCKFCATKTGKPLPLDADEPKKLADSIEKMKLKHCVITSVDRDELPDKGSQHWVHVVDEIRRHNLHIIIELLIPDYEEKLLLPIINSQPDIIGHNLETVERLTPAIRSKATYRNSLTVIENIAKSDCIAKTGLMVGLGEKESEVIQTLKDARDAGCQMVTIGQYLRPRMDNVEVTEYVHPDIFEKYKIVGQELGFRNIESSPLVRSSYMAENSFSKISKRI